MPREHLGYVLLSTEKLMDEIPSYFGGLDDDEFIVRVVVRDGKPQSVEIVEL